MLFSSKDTVVINNIKFIEQHYGMKLDKNKLNNIIPTQHNKFILYNNI